MPRQGDEQEDRAAAEEALRNRVDSAERRLRDQLRILEAIGTSSPDFTYVLDLDQRFVYASPPLLRLWGRTLAEVIGKNFEDLGYPPELVRKHREQLDQVLAGKTISGSNPYVDHNGVEGLYEYTFVPVWGEGGRVETIVGTTRDVTERLRSERERAAAHAALSESEAQFRHFADAIPQLAWIARADGHIIWYNRRWYEYTGTTPAEMEGWGWQRVHDPAELPKVMERWTHSLATGEAFEMAFPLRGRDGGYRSFLTRVQPIHNGRGEIIRWFGTNTDVEAQRQALVERDAALASATMANRAKDEFLAMLGHELRNPLAPIVTALKLIEMKGQITREYDIIDRQVKHLCRLVDDLLDTARITQGKVELRRAPIEVATAVRRGIEMASPLLERRRQGLKLDVPPEGLLVLADPDRLAQVVSNLVTNASKFSEPGASVTVEASRQGNTIRIRVRDEGDGIAPEMLDRIFDAFVQQGQPLDRSAGGLGLGLSIVKNLVELHGGSVSAHSAGPGAGSEFTVELKALEGAGAVVVPDHARRPGWDPDAPRGRILVVDDNGDAAAALAEFLGGEGHEVRVAEDAPSALELAAGFRPHIALLDIGLPVVDGWELGRRLRDLPGAHHLKVVAVTGYGQDADRRRSDEAGFSGHLLKPVNLEALTKLIADLGFAEG